MGERKQAPKFPPIRNVRELMDALFGIPRVKTDLQDFKSCNFTLAPEREKKTMTASGIGADLNLGNDDLPDTPAPREKPTDELRERLARDLTRLMGAEWVSTATRMADALLASGWRPQCETFAEAAEACDARAAAARLIAEKRRLVGDYSDEAECLAVAHEAECCASALRARVTQKETNGE